MVEIQDNYYYYGSVRNEILPLLPDHAARVLDVGCGAGNTLLWIRELRMSVWIGGVELDPAAAAQARDKLDAVYGESIEEMRLPVPEGTLDLILCLDVLEHLRDPWRVAQYLNTLLRPGGSLIVSIPNIRNRRVLLPLVLRGTWEYTDSGILDRTHLRFFTRKSAIDLVASAGCMVDRIEVTGGISRGRKGKLLKFLLPEWVQQFFARQYLIRGIKKG